MDKGHPNDIATTISSAKQALARGDVATTERLCQYLVNSAPKDPNGWALLAETALIRGRPDAAKVCAERAATLAPRDAIARIMQAKALFVSGEIVDAAKAAETAAPLVGKAAATADALAAMFGLLGRHRQALEFSHRAVAAEPDNPQFLFNLAATERMLGALAEAETHCDEAIAHDPRYALAYYLRSDLRTQSPARHHVAEMEQLVASGRLDWRSETLLHYALAKECEDIDEHGRAFAHADAGAKLWRQHINYDARADLAEIDRIIATQDAHWLTSIAKSRVVDAPIFVCGLPRTGTTLVERIVASHSLVESVGESGVFAVKAAPALARGGKTPDFDAIGGHYVRAVKTVFRPQKRRFVDKTLRNYLYCGLIHAALPNAKIILVERQPMDVAWALYKAHFNGGFLFSYDLVELAYYYLAYHRLVEHWTRTLPPGTVLTVRYEAVVRNLPEESSRILKFLGLPWEDSVLRFDECKAPSATASAVQVRRPIYATSVDKWQLHEEALDPFRERLRMQATAYPIVFRDEKHEN